CNFFLTSANAVTQSGEIINIDGMGNRVSATVFGPGEVIMVIGLNKIAGDLAAGLSRSKEVAAVLNAKRLGRKTPCVQTGICTDCDSPERICNVSVILHRRPREKSGFGGGFKIIVVGESLGF
ncbi:MAG TPA: LUD domain-containing protein, partial [Verrucomicrobiae bacterium]|nr:LUD domain-containing protein [Verrucomicrobiae bacterium]